MSNERPLYDGIPKYPHRLVDDTGDAFVIGLTFGSVFHFVKGLLNSPNGSRLAGASRAVRTNAPRIAGRCAAYGALFCNFQTAMYLARGRDDYWTLIAAGTATSGVFLIRKGAPAAARSALLGATVFAGLAGLYRATESWESRLRSRRESQRNHGRGLPAPTTVVPDNANIKGQITMRDQIILYGRKG